MTKKYRLKIPEMISSDQAELVVVLQKTYEGCELSAVGDQVYKGQGYRTDIPKNWLEEIKDEPMSAEESWEECQYCCDMDYSQTEWKSIFLEGFHAGAAENEKKHRAKKSCNEVWIENFSNFPDYAFKHGWKACEKNRGFDD